MKSLSVVYIILTLLLCACHGNDTKAATSSVARDTTITPENSFTNLRIDSALLENFIKENKLEDKTAASMKDFYNSRNYQPAWFTEEGPSESLQQFWNLHEQYIDLNKDSALYNRKLHEKVDALLDVENDVPFNAGNIEQLEMQLTKHFFEFARYAYAGKLDPDRLKWNIPRKKIDAVELLNSLLSTPDDSLKAWEPVHPQYQLLRKELKRYYEMQQSGKWQPIANNDDKVFRKGDSSQTVVQLKERLQLMGDYSSSDLSPVYDEALYEAIKQLQKRFGLEQDGITGPQVLSALNVPVEERIKQILINMERMRWLPPEPAEKRIVVNIPEFKVHVYEQNDEVLSMNIVVGKAGHNTVIFSNKVHYVVFSPYWNVPASIVRNEILPKMKSNSGYLQRMNMEITGHSNGLPVVRQKPGGNNALGRVKFLFPNKYNIYLHDTPAKSLFEQNQRAFSHGCIRVSKPFDLAAYLLKNKPEWTNEKIRNAMNNDREQWVTLKEQVPVFIYYFTAWVDKDGKLNFRNDIYGHDKRMADHLFR